MVEEISQVVNTTPPPSKDSSPPRPYTSDKEHPLERNLQVLHEETPHPAIPKAEPAPKANPPFSASFLWLILGTIKSHNTPLCQPTATLANPAGMSTVRVKAPEAFKGTTGYVIEHGNG
ncbi:unnamed protein product [Rhizoctonia solani]|uniref:Uncharacterized protein n=1 Tax=Rhizoctonia solani TaxID=456999 RepID=A0A8H2ZYD4_9AGAM|nr:unnamed protein product [Rhizoctonia solani]